MRPVPCPNAAQQEDEIAPGNPSSLQTTAASFRSQPSSHTVPQVLLWYIPQHAHCLLHFHQQDEHWLHEFVNNKMDIM